jgi:hypothetical protein
MSTITFVKKTPGFTWEYKCKCTDGTDKPNVTVFSTNENEAQQLAQQKCDDACDTAGEGGP